MLLKKLQDISIRSKLVLMQVFTSVIVLTIVFIVFVITDIRGYKDRKVNSMESIAQVVATNSVSTLQFQDADAAEQILGELKKVAPEIQYAAIINKDKLFASYKQEGVDSFDITALGKRNYIFLEKKLLIRKPIVNDNQVMGQVILGVDLSELEQIKRSKYELVWILLLVAIAFSFLIAFVIQPYISKRLLGLVKTIKDVSETGDYNKTITDSGKDEISTLIKVYDKLMRQVQESQQKKDEFIGIASHEFKTPLTSIKGYLDLLNLMETDEVKMQMIGKSQRNVVKLESLIKDLLDVSKIQSGQLQLNLQEFNMAELLDETISSFQMLSQTHYIIWEKQTCKEKIWADRQRIEQVLINLLSNAIKYSPGEKQVEVTCERNDGELIVGVRDFGIGVLPEERQNIFERFYRTKDTSIHISGFGLGLYICKDIIKRHKGKIWVEASNKGSIFYFTLPLKNT